MILVLIFFLVVPFTANGHTSRNQETSKTSSLARELLLRAAGMVYPSHLEALLNIGKLQALAGDDLNARATFEQIERQIRTLPLRTEIPNSEGEVLERERYKYYLMLTTTQWESGYTDLAVNTIRLARKSIEAIRSPRDKVAAFGQFFLAQVQLELPLQTIELLDGIAPRDLDRGRLTYQKVETLLSTSRALHDNGSDRKATQLLQDALLKIEHIEYGLSRSTLLAPLIGMLLRTGHRSMAEERLHEELLRLDELPPNTDNSEVILEKTQFLVEMAKSLYDLGDSTYSQYINKAVAATQVVSPKPEWIRSSALRTIALTKVTLGDLDGALAIEEEITDEDYKDQSLPGIAEAAIANGEFAQAIDLAHRVGIRDPPQKAFILSEISKAMAKQGDIKNALKIASQVGFPFKAEIYFSLARVIARTQSLEYALALVEQENDSSYYQAFILMGAANGLLQASQ